MRFLPLALAASLLAAPAFTQTLTREYRVPFAGASSDVGATSAFASLNVPGYPLPEVDDGPFVRTIEVGFDFHATQLAEADYVNTTSSPIQVSTGGYDIDQYAIIGNPNGCAIGFDPCSTCGSGGGTAVLPPNSTLTRVQASGSVDFMASSSEAGASPFAWPCILNFNQLLAGALVSTNSLDAVECRAQVDAFGYTFKGVELAVNPAVATSCPGTPNSTGLTAEIEYFGSTDAGSGRAAVQARNLPAGQPVLCVITNASAITPLGVGPLPNLCLRGSRYAQEVQFTQPGPGAGVAVFDVPLALLTAGDSFAIQIGHRDTGNSVNTSNMLVGTAQ